jgi:hypothetical protein
VPTGATAGTGRRVLREKEGHKEGGIVAGGGGVLQDYRAGRGRVAGTANTASRGKEGNAAGTGRTARDDNPGSQGPWGPMNRRATAGGTEDLHHEKPKDRKGPEGGSWACRDPRSPGRYRYVMVGWIEDIKGWDAHAPPSAS